MHRSIRGGALLTALLLAACGGGGGDNGSNSTGSGNPTPATYTVGGSISGLTASGLALLNEGGDPLSVVANATGFTFPSAQQSGSPYAVTVQSQPSGESCTVANGSGTVTANVSSVQVSCSAAAVSNVVTMTVGNGPGAPGGDTFNIPYVTVTVCNWPNTSQCATIDHVLVDTGSVGFRVMASALTSGNVTLTPVSSSGNTLYECLPFADGYAWGTVASAQLQIGGETANDIPIQIIDDANPQPTNIPSGSLCTDNGTYLSLDSEAAFDAKGVLGMGLFAQDCGPACASQTNQSIYYTCPASGSCTATTVILSDQVTNPVALFATDNNGVVLYLQPISATGAPSAQGTLTFGINTQINNALGAATVLTTNANGEITTQYKGANLTSSFIDSGSNGLYFNDSSISTCPSSLGKNAPDFYCPGSTLSRQAINQGGNGGQITTAFHIADLSQISGQDYAIDGVGGPASPVQGFGSYFDWGLPFFFGKKVFFALEGPPIGANLVPFYAY